MDKYEYKIRSEEIIKLMESEKYADAVAIADTIDWNKVRSVIMLERIGELYRINRRYEESREVYFIAYERNPGNRKLIYELCELSIEMEDILQAMQFYNEYTKVVPRDNIGVYTLRYRIYEAQEVSLEERIELLEELKKKDYLEEWAYELAYLYHRVGLSAKCVEECDELILWFGEGPYVIKAMELKMLHEPLTPEQQAKYDARNQGKIDEEGRAAAKEDLIEDDFRVKTIDMGKFNTMNLQAELAENLKEIMSEDENKESEEPQSGGFPDTGDFVLAQQKNDAPEEAFVKMDTIVVSGNVAKVTPPECLSTSASVNETVQLPGYQKEQEIFFEDKTADIKFPSQNPQDGGSQNPELEKFKRNFLNQYQSGKAPQSEGMQEGEHPSQEDGRRASKDEAVANAKAMFSQEYDGQMSIVVPENNMIEKQITGQMNLQDVIAEWEKLKKENEEKQRASVRRLVMEQTGPIFTEFNESIRNGLLSDLEYVEKDDPDVNSDDIMFTDLEADDKDLAAHEDMTEVIPPVDVVRRELAELEGKPLFRNTEVRKEEASKEQIAETATEAAEEQTGETTMEAVEEQTGETTMEAVEEQTGETAMETAEEQTAETTMEAVEEQTGETTMEAVEEQTGETIMEAVEEQTGETTMEVAREHAVKSAIEQAKEQAAGTASEVVGAQAGVIAESEVLSEVVAKEISILEKENRSIWDELKEAGEQTEVGEQTETVSEAIEQEEDSPEEEIIDILDDVENDRVVAFEAIGVEDNERDTKELKAPDGIVSDDTGVVFEAVTDPDEDAIPGESTEEINARVVNRELTKEEKSLFADFIYSPKMCAQLTDTLEKMSLASYTGNVMITGETGFGGVALAKNLVKEVQLSDDNFSGKVAKISGETLNHKDMGVTFGKLSNGALIVEGAGDLQVDTLNAMVKALNQENTGILVILTDTKKGIGKLITRCPVLTDFFNARIDIAAMGNDVLAAYGKSYALEMEYAIDELGVLALYSRIADRQTGTHSVITDEVKEIVDEAIRYSKKPRLSTFGRILVAKRYDSEDRIILGEKDFVH